MCSVNKRSVFILKKRRIVWKLVRVVLGRYESLTAKAGRPKIFGTRGEVLVYPRNVEVESTDGPGIMVFTRKKDALSLILSGEAVVRMEVPKGTGCYIGQYSDAKILCVSRVKMLDDVTPRGF
jgi:hypothetical protein